MALSTFQGPIRSMGGSYNQGPESVVALTADTTINPTDHAGKLILINNSTLTITLPILGFTFITSPVLPLSLPVIQLLYLLF